MILVDTALKQRASEGRPLHVVVTGAGWMGRHITRQVSLIDGMEMVGVVNRTVSRAAQNLTDAGSTRIEEVNDRDQARRAIGAGVTVVTGDPGVLCSADGVDVVIETTGDIEFGAKVALASIEAGKHIVLDNAELDATVGPILKVRADRAGVVITGIDGDEPGVAMNLLRFVTAIGLRPVLVGNIKGFLNHHRNPDTQADFAGRHGQNAVMISSFADGTKLAAECTVLANATGFRVAKPGMHGFELKEVGEVISQFDPGYLLEHPTVDFVLGAKPGSGVFVVGHDADPERRAAMEYLKMGSGPLHLFTRPFHLPHLEAPLSAARAVLFRDTVVAPMGAPVCEMIAFAKRDLERGDVLDGLGGFTNYAIIHNADQAATQNLLPMGLTLGGTMKRSVTADTPLTFDDVDLVGGAVFELRREQDLYFGTR